MFGILKTIFSADAGAGKVVDAATKAGDKLFYTKQEKAELFPKLLKLYEPFKIAQRYLAVMYSSVFLFIHVVGLAVFIFMDETKAQIIWKHNIDTLGYPVLLIVGFYFAGGVVNPAAKRLTGWISKAQEKINKPSNEKIK